MRKGAPQCPPRGSVRGARCPSGRGAPAVQKGPVGESPCPLGPRNPRACRAEELLLWGAAAGISSLSNPAAGAPSGLSHRLLPKGCLLHPTVPGTHGHPIFPRSVMCKQPHVRSSPARLSATEPRGAPHQGRVGCIQPWPSHVRWPLLTSWAYLLHFACSSTQR